MNAKLLFLSFICFFCFLSGNAQDSTPDSLLSSPYDAVYNHLYYLQSENYDVSKSAQSILGFEKTESANSMAIKIKQVLDAKGLYVRMSTIPDDQNFVDSTTGLSLYRLFPSKQPEIAVERSGNQWYYSQETMEAIPDLHQELYPFGSRFLVNLAPKIGSQRVLGLALWQYLGFGLLILASFLAHKIMSWLLKLLINFLSDSRLKEYLDPKKVLRIARAASLFLLVYFIQLFLPALLLPIELSKVLVLALKIASLAFGVILALRLADLLMLYFSRFTSKTESNMDDQILPIIQRVIQALIIIGGIIQGLRLLDVNVTALIAGVSIGGLAIALAAQDTVKNLIGSVMIFIDRPFQIGDFVSGGGVVGTVEEVGFRSTRIRSADTSLISVPNGKMADTTVENFGLRSYRRFYFKAGLTYDTPPVLINAFVEGVRELIQSHPHTRKDAMEVHLNEFSESSINVLILMYIISDSWSLELKTRHEMMIGILELAEQLGVRFAFPSSTLYVESFPEKNANPPAYRKDPTEVNKTVEEYLQAFKAKFPDKEDSQKV